MQRRSRFRDCGNLEKSRFPRNNFLILTKIVAFQNISFYICHHLKHHKHGLICSELWQRLYKIEWSGEREMKQWHWDGIIMHIHPSSYYNTENELTN